MQDIKSFDVAFEENVAFYELLRLAYYDHYKRVVIEAIEGSIWSLDYTRENMRILIGKEKFFSYSEESVKQASFVLQEKASSEAFKNIREELELRGWCLEAWKDPEVNFGVDEKELYLVRYKAPETREFKPEEAKEAE